MSRLFYSLLIQLICLIPGYASPDWDVILIVADDLGYADLGCYGSTDIQTPNLDRLAAEGIRFTNFYANAPECTPTRTALLTGRYQQRAGGLECAIGLDNVGRYDDAIRLAENDQLGLPHEYTILPHVFKQRDYAAAMFGKWHLGDGAEFHPNRHGFDLFLGPTGGAVDYFHHTEPKGVFLGIPIEGERDFYRNSQPLDRGGEYLTSLISVRAVDWIRDTARQNKRYFLYLPYTAPHAPYQGPGDWRQEQLTTDEWNVGTRETYVAMVEALDRGIGRILDALRRENLEKQTIIIFFSDNGPAKLGDAGSLRGNKGKLFEGGIKVPCIVRWPGRIDPGQVSGQTAISMDLTASLVAMLGASPRPGRELDGIDLLGHVIAGKQDYPRQLFWRKIRGTATWKAARDGSLKYILHQDPEANVREDYLFDLSVDPGEQDNLNKSHPEQLRRLKSLLKEWEQTVKSER